MKFTKTDRMKYKVYREVLGKAVEQLSEQIGLKVHYPVQEHVVVQILGYLSCLMIDQLLCKLLF